MAESPLKKYAPRVPDDILLARAFRFRPGDLDANRAGFMTWRQRGLADYIAQRGLNWLAGLVPGGLLQGGRSARVESICGRVSLRHTIVDRMGPRSQIFYEYFNLIFEGHARSFPLTARQYRALAEHLVYRVYYHPEDPLYILSIERVIGGCSRPEDQERSSSTST